MRTTRFLIYSFMLATAYRLPAQSTFGGIVGSVKDSSGAAVPQAGIEVRNVDENTVRQAVTNADGLYEVLNLSPGNYEVTASRPGFSRTRLSGIRLEARQTIRAEVRLEVQAVQEVVEVSGTVTAINTENGTIADTKTFAQVTQLPVNYRGKTTSPLGAIVAVPGVEQDTAGNISIAGGLPAQADYSVDGVSTVSVRSNGPIKDMYPSSEMLSEFRVTKVNNNAEFGQMGDVTVVSKSGANAVHGSAFWYHQNAALDATVYNAPQKQAKVFNTFGGSVSGPVELPHLYHGRNRTFFFIDYEGNREPGSTLGLFSVPTASMRQGNLSGVPGKAAIDPLTGSPFPGNAMPQSRISSVSATLLSDYFPLPNSPGASTVNNYRRLLPTPSQTDGYDLRIDHVIDSRQQLFGRFSWKNNPYTSGTGVLLPADQYQVDSRNLIVSHNFSITPHVLNEFRFGLSHWTLNDHFPLAGKSVVSTLGLQGLNLDSLPAATGGFPNFDFSDGTGFSAVLHSRDGLTRSTNYEFTENLTWIKGRHSMKFGADIRFLGYDDVLRYQGADGFGNFTFTSSAFSGNAFSDLLLGIPAMSYYAVMGPNLSQRVTHSQMYAQDEWRLNDRFTVSFGLRYEIHPPMGEENGNITNFDPATASVITPDHTPPAAPGFLIGSNACPGITTQFPCTKIVTASQAGLPQGLRHTYYGNWDPRVSVAWRPFGGNRTVIRTGGGIFTENVLGPTAYPFTAVHTSDLRTYTNFQGAGKPPLFTFPQVQAGAFAVTAVGNENFVSGMDVHYKDPRAYQWNLTLEHQLRGGTTVRTSYIGAHSVGLGVKEDLNQVPSGKTPYSPALKPYPDWAQLAYFYNVGFASYQALDAEITHRYHSGVFLQGSYTFSRNIGNAAAGTGGAFNGSSALPSEVFTGLLTDRFNTRLDRGNLPGTRPHRFLLTAQYDLPFGRGRRFGARMNRVADAFVGGWNLSTIALVQSGPWVTPIMSPGLDQSNTNVLSRGVRARPNRIANGNLDNPTRNAYFDINAFALPAAGCGCFGNAGEGILEGPGTVSIAGGLAKTFAITEKLRLRVEATFTNLPNHPNFLPPQTNISTPATFGKLTAVQAQENSGNRTGQVSARFDF